MHAVKGRLLWRGSLVVVVVAVAVALQALPVAWGCAHIRISNALALAAEQHLACSPHMHSLHLLLEFIKCKRGACIGSLKRDGGREGGSVSRRSPYLVVLKRELFSASEQGVAQPSGVGVSARELSVGSCWIIA